MGSRLKVKLSPGHTMVMEEGKGQWNKFWNF
jgi:hypothetical protein